MSFSKDSEYTNGDPDEKWGRFQDWIHCICVVTFDLELGQAMEKVFPPDVHLTDEEKCNICYLAFPDSNSGCMGNTKFHVRLRTGTSLTRQQLEYNNECPQSLKADSSHLWGFVYFRQVKNPDLPRGYFQKSIIVLTRLPFINLYYNIIQLIAPKHFENDADVLEVACHDINRWPLLEAGQNVLLPLLGTVFQSYIPNKSTSKVSRSHIDIISQIHSPEMPHILTFIEDVKVFDILSSVISHLHLLWELVLTAEPLVIMASSPTECSAMVQALINLIDPLTYAAEYRPYFTIHDSEFKEFTKKQFNPPHVILGVTNPFFTKTLQHWPHTIRLGQVHKTKLKKLGNIKLLDSSPGVYTQYKPFLIKDKAIIKKLHNGIQSDRPPEAQAALIKRHLLELTQSFMIPLERYMGSLMPLQKNISPFRAPPIPNPFNPEGFFNSLQQAGPHLTTGIKGDWNGLYRKFFKSPNFNAWFLQRHTELTDKLQSLQLEALAESDLKDWATDKNEVEVVDMVIRLKQVLGNTTPMPDNTKTLLSRRLEDITNTLPEDLRNILRKT